MDKLRTTIILSLILTMLAVVAQGCNQPIEEEVASEPTQTQEAATHKAIPLIAVHDDVDTPETESVTEEVTEPPVATGETTPSTTSYYNVNLPEYVQDVIFAECDKYGISPAIIIAMIERESQFDRYAMGDDGRSFGLMQVQPKNHLQRMIELGCTDLFDPIQNITVGINYLAEMQNQYGDIAKALVAYNGGSYKGTITNYATSVMARANEL
jgi:soluble lytic murein transglycosylase-like protein